MVVGSWYREPLGCALPVVCARVKSARRTQKIVHFFCNTFKRGWCQEWRIVHSLPPALANGQLSWRTRLLCAPTSPLNTVAVPYRCRSAALRDESGGRTLNNLTIFLPGHVCANSMAPWRHAAVGRVRLVLTLHLVVALASSCGGKHLHTSPQNC